MHDGTRSRKEHSDGLSGHIKLRRHRSRASVPGWCRTIPESGRKSLYLASHAGRIFGMPENEGRALIDQLIGHATQRQFVYTHRWRVNDLIMWDNRCTMHRGTEFDDLRWKRDVQRATVSDIANSCEQEGIEIAAA
jgi:alpha-ketoglutarate-dependent 2,4-dichlorophenoxyacetate dioxygenase